MNTFTFVGNIIIPKDTEKFKAYSVEILKDKWEKRTLTLNVSCGDNKHSIRVQDFGDKDINNRAIYTVLNKNADGKYTSVKIDFKDREDKIKDVAPFKKFVLDTGDADERAKIYSIKNRYEKDEDLVTEEEKTKYNITSEEDIEKLIEKSYDERKEFICEYDFINALYDTFSNDKYKNCKFKVTGNYQFTKSIVNGETKYYAEYIPTRIIRVKSDVEYESTMSAEIIYKDSSNIVTTENIDGVKNTVFNGWLVNYNKNYKKDDPDSEKDISMPITINMNTFSDKSLEKFKDKLDIISASSTYKVIGLVINCIDGSPTLSFTEDMLTEDEKADIECGFYTFEDLKKEKGALKGEKIKEFRFSKIGTGYTGGGKDTAYPSSMFENVSNKANTDDKISDIDLEDINLDDIISLS